jgi:hypothetical protein
VDHVDSFTAENPFDELPEALVEEMLKQCDGLASILSDSFKNLSEKKDKIRLELKSGGYLKKDTSLSTTPSHPTSCGIDGSYAVEKLLSTDVVAMAGVAVEGLTPPSEIRHWPRPHHMSEVKPVLHSDSTSLVARAIMMCMELQLAGKAPHDVVFLDGSMTTPIIYLNQALSRLYDSPKILASLLDEMLEPALESYITILKSERTDKIYAAVPKYTTRREISEKIPDCRNYEDRGLLTFVLEAGEFVGPLPIKQPNQPWHIAKYKFDSLIDNVTMAANNLFIVYYRPFDHFPALRIEIAPTIATNIQRLSVLFESLRLQCSSPSIVEPYPLYLADRMVKHLSTALPAIRRATTQEMSLKWDDRLGNVNLAMRGYRTDFGK